MAALRETFLAGCRHALLLSGLPIILLFVYAPQLMALWVGSEYVASSAPILRIAMVNVLLCVPAMIAYEVLVAMGRIQGPALLLISAGIANVLLAIALVTLGGLGLQAIALSMLVTNGILVTLYTLCRAKHELSIRRVPFFADVLLRPVWVFMPIAFLALALQRFAVPVSWFSLILQSAICGIAYAVLAFSTAISSVERTKLQTVLQRLLAAPFRSTEKPVDGARL